MVRAQVTVGNKDGIHLEFANRIVNVADQFHSRIHLKTDYMDINAKSIINLVSGVLRYGDTLLCVCDGSDEKEALAAMKEIIESASDE